jgi:hypothetical protein
MTEAEWLACDDPLEMLEALQLESHFHAKARILRSWRLLRWLVPRLSQHDNQRPLFSERQLYLLACAIDRAWWWANNGENPPRFELQERYAEGEVALEELRAGAPQCQWPWADPWGLLFEMVRRVCVAREFDRVRRAYCDFARDIFRYPFRPLDFSPEWRTDTAVTLTRTMYDARDFSAMSILADALQDAGCDCDDVLNHCRDTNQVHVRGCWVCDLVLGKA